MAIQLPPPERPLVDLKTGKMDYRWRQAFDEIVTALNSPSVPDFNVVDLPPPKRGAIAFVPDETGGPVLAYSGGFNWRRSTDGNIVS